MTHHLIRALVCDIDGCLVGTNHVAFDTAAIHELAELNRASNSDPTIPALTILSGRPHAYVDALMQLFDIRLPAVFENGAGLAHRYPYRADVHPKAQKGQQSLKRLAELLQDYDDLTIQPGKIASMSVFPYPHEHEGSTDALLNRLRALLEEHRLDLKLDPASECINVLVPDVDKGTGITWLASVIGVPSEQLAGIGDSVGDLAWLKHCGVSCAPSNAHAKLKPIVSVALELVDIQATLAFYHRLIETNRQLPSEVITEAGVLNELSTPGSKPKGAA